jgi:hypothetical protein
VADEEGSSKNEQHMEPVGATTVDLRQVIDRLLSNDALSSVPNRLGPAPAWLPGWRRTSACFADLSAVYEVDKDYRIVLEHWPQVTAWSSHRMAVASRRTPRTSPADRRPGLSYYLFEGLLKAGNFAALHLSSHRFDEASCLELLSGCDHGRHPWLWA